jgi:hypothetical protein
MPCRGSRDGTRCHGERLDQVLGEWRESDSHLELDVRRSSTLVAEMRERRVTFAPVRLATSVCNQGRNTRRADGGTTASRPGATRKGLA